MIRLLSHEKCPPGEFYYRQGGSHPHRFGHTPIITDLARRVASYRQANKLAGADMNTALADIDAFTCARLGNSPQWCYDTDKPIEAIYPAHGCATCGHH